MQSFSLVTTLTGAGFLFDSWMCLAAGTVASRLDEPNHVRPLVVGPSNVNKPHLFLLFSLLLFSFFLASFLYSGRECHPSWFFQQWCVWKRVFGSLLLCQRSISAPSLPSACSEVAQKWQKYPDFNRREQNRGKKTCQGAVKTRREVCRTAVCSSSGVFISFFLPPLLSLMFAI